MAKNKLPDGYKSIEKLTEEFRKDNPKGKIETAAQDLGDGYVIISAKITKEDGAVGSGMADADVQDDKAVEKAETGAIRRALLTLGYKSVEGENSSEGSDEPEEKEEKQERRSFGGRRDEKEEKEEKSDRDDKPRSRFGGKSNENDRSRDRDDKQDSEESEGESKFKRGSRFQRN